MFGITFWIKATFNWEFLINSGCSLFVFRLLSILSHFFQKLFDNGFSWTLDDSLFFSIFSSENKYFKFKSVVLHFQMKCKQLVRLTNLKWDSQGRRKFWESRGGGCSNVVGIICPLVEIGISDLPKNGRARAPLPPSCDSPGVVYPKEVPKNHHLLIFFL